MKRILTLLMAGLFLVSLMAAQQSKGENLSENIPTLYSANRVNQEMKTMIQQRLKFRNQSLDCEGCNLSINGSRIRAKLSNGRNSEVKIMPEVASQRALERLRLKVCNRSNNCSIELKEVGRGNKTRLAYELQAERHYKLLGMFRTKAQNRVKVDAENGEIISEGKPWWGFLAREVED